MKSVLVTGGAGFVGSNIAIALKKHKENIRVVVLDNLLRRGTEGNLFTLEKYGIEFIHGDVRIADDLQRAGKIDFLVECSAEPSVLAGSDGSPGYVIQTNLNGAVNCAEYCRQHNDGLLFLSTSRVYSIDSLKDMKISEGKTRFELSGEQSVDGLSIKGVSEECSVQGFKSFYGASKIAAEFMLEEYRYLFDWPVIINRCGLIAGPGQFGKADQGIISFWLNSHLEKNSLKYIGFGGSGKQVRDATHIDDLVRLVILQMTKPEKFKKDVFNVGGGLKSSFSLLELTNLCREITGNKLDIAGELTERYADIPVYLSDTTKINQLCEWKSELNIEDIIQDVYNWLIDRRNL
ncbi:MAG: NAD-dependent epimerase/dehydratase family protein [Lentisphaerales bacterium]|nr:NAD-dependent epimerase/dehydratase family protein [Lentisphaerales bacterium]